MRTEREDGALGESGGVEPVLDRLAESGQPEHPEREPQLEGATAPCELDTGAAEVDLLRRVGVLQIICPGFEGAAESVPLAREEAAGAGPDACSKSGD